MDTFIVNLEGHKFIDFSSKSTPSMVVPPSILS